MILRANFLNRILVVGATHSDKKIFDVSMTKIHDFPTNFNRRSDTMIGIDIIRAKRENFFCFRTTVNIHDFPAHFIRP